MHTGSKQVAREVCQARVFIEFCLIAAIVAAPAQAGQGVTSSQGSGQSNVTPSPWPSASSEDQPKRDDTLRMIGPGGSSASSGRATPTWDHPPTPSKLPAYKCVGKKQTTFQDTPCSRSQGVQTDLRHSESEPIY